MSLGVSFSLYIENQCLVEFDLSVSLDPFYFSWFILCPWAMAFFQKLCPTPSLLFHAPFLSPVWAHNVASTIFWRDNQKIAGLGKEILYNIQPPDPTQYWSHWRSWGRPNSSPGGPRRSSRLDLPRDQSSKGCHASTCSGIL